MVEIQSKVAELSAGKFVVVVMSIHTSRSDGGSDSEILVFFVASAKLPWRDVDTLPRREDERTCVDGFISWVCTYIARLNRAAIILPRTGEHWSIQ